MKDTRKRAAVACLLFKAMSLMALGFLFEINEKHRLKQNKK